MTSMNSEEAAVSAAHELLGVEEPETPASGSEAEEGVTVHTPDEVEFPDFNIELPAELAAELAEPELDLESLEDDDEYQELVEQYGDNELVRRALAAEKKAAHFEQLRLKESRKNWSEEAEKFFPLAQPFLEQLNANSRRGFLRQAKLIHEQMAPIVEEKVLKPAREAIASAKTQAIAEGKDEARDAWGQPVTQRVPSEVTVTTDVMNGRRRRGEFSDTIRGMIFPKGDKE